MSFEPIDGKYLNTLESSGIIDAYEYVLRKLIEENLPRTQVYEKCARYLLEYQQLLLENNIRAKNAQSFVKLSNLEEEKKKEVRAKEIIPSFPITLKSRLLFEQEENRPPQKIFETNIDELMKNKLNLLSKNTLNEQMRSNLKGYGSYAAFVENENEKIRMYNFKINAKFSGFQFTPMEEIEKGNYSNEEINSNNYNNNIDNNINSYNSPNSESEFTMPKGGERINTQASRKSTNKTNKTNKSNKSKITESESVSSKEISSSEQSRIRKISKQMADDLLKK